MGSENLESADLGGVVAERSKHWDHVDSTWFTGEVESRFEILGMPEATTEIRVRMANEIIGLYRVILVAHNMSGASSARIKRDALADVGYLSAAGILDQPPSLVSLLSGEPASASDPTVLGLLPRVPADAEELLGRPGSGFSGARASSDFVRRPETMHPYLAELLGGA